MVLPPIAIDNLGTYEGEWQRGKKEGFGKFKFRDGSVYEGQFKKDKASGQGKLEFAHGDTYDGEWQANMANGYGIDPNQAFFSKIMALDTKDIGTMTNRMDKVRSFGKMDRFFLETTKMA